MKPKNHNDDQVEGAMAPPSPDDVTITGDSAFVAEQVGSGISIRDLELPKVPTNEVFIWENENPLHIGGHELLSQYVFRWLYPKGREKKSMAGWQYVAGDMAAAVRRCGIIPSLIGGDGDDENIRSGDLILGWMHKAQADAKKIYYQKKSNEARQAAEEQVESARQMKSGPGGKYIQQYGEVTSHFGPLQE